MNEYKNQIQQKDIKSFIPQKLCDCEYIYHHSQDCQQSGCRGHIAKLQYYSASDMFHLDFGDGNTITLDKIQMNIVYDWIDRLKI